jgi:putative oxidoreductase
MDCLHTIKDNHIKIIKFLINWPEHVASHFLSAGPLVARTIVGYVFVLTGWIKLNNLPQMIEQFSKWGIPFPHIITPVTSGIECFGGLFIMVGLITRISGGALAVVMAVAIISTKLNDIDSLATLLGFEETTYFAVFTWLAICGAGKVSLDHLIIGAPAITSISNSKIK